jgi:undecaprenyl phosphate N,N'-diacetylbacillosamine 1-phosphate transferase
MGLYQNYGKRIFDLGLCLVSAPVVLPSIGLLSLISLVKKQDKILYYHLRPGQGGKLFLFYKMSTLSDQEVASGRPLSMLERQSGWGKFMRDYSLDELPQWFNILKGDMSWVGPRPLLPEYLDHYTERQQLRHRVKPGITGLAQVLGRNNLSWHRKLAADWLYVKNLSFGLDCWILYRTCISLIKKQETNFGKPELVGPPV